MALTFAVRAHQRTVKVTIRIFYNCSHNGRFLAAFAANSRIAGEFVIKDVIDGKYLDVIHNGIMDFKNK